MLGSFVKIKETCKRPDCYVGKVISWNSLDDEWSCIAIVTNLDSLDDISIEEFGSDSYAINGIEKIIVEASFKRSLSMAESNLKEAELKIDNCTTRHLRIGKYLSDALD